MCGIAGIFSPSVVSVSSIEKAQMSLYSRGPDAQVFTSWDAEGRLCNEKPVSALIHTRLSIRDLNPRANQPMSDSSGKVWICYNGEVYDWEDRKRTLIGEGYEFHTTSDTEFILNSYLRDGIGCLSYLRGMFSFCIYDMRVGKAFLCRDRMGQKPMYYSCHDGVLTFGSNFKSVWALLDGKQKTLNKYAIDAFLAHRYIPAPLTLSNEIFKLENGFYLEWDLSKRILEKHSYWEPYKASSSDWLQVFIQAVDIRTVSDRPVGVFLSGGIDSTAIASALARKGHRDITAFTASFQDPRFDESEVAKKTALSLGLPIIEIPIPLDIELSLFDQIVDDLDEPFADPSAFPTWLLCRETSKHVTVVLGGDGGDELFAGYKRYNKHLKSAWRGGLSLAGSPFKTTDTKKGKILSELKMSWGDAYSLRFSGHTPAQRSHSLSDLEVKQNVYWRKSQFEDNAKLTPLKKMLAIDYGNYLPEYILKKGDLCSMAHGLELRCPFMDHQLFASLSVLSDQERFSSPAKQILSRVSPQVENVAHFKKRGFNPPLTHWLRASWSQRFPEIGERLANRSHGVINAVAAQAMVEEYLKGRENLAEQVLQLLILDRILAAYSFN